MESLSSILRVCSYPTDLRPGMGLAVYELAGLVGFRTTILSYRPERGETYLPPKSGNARLIPLPFPNPVMPKKRAGALFLLRQLQRLAAILQFNGLAALQLLRERPEIVHIHSPMHVLTALAGRVCGAVTCLTIHGTDFTRIAESKVLRGCLRSIDVIFCMTHAHERQLREWFPGKQIVYVANGTDIDYFSDRSSSAPPRCKQVVGVGTLRWHKNFAALIRAFSTLAKADPEWQLTILGEGPDRERLKELANSLGISDRVSLPGSVSRGQLRDTLQHASIFVLSSVTEGIPKALLEAMAAGCACLSTDVGDCGEVLGAAGVVVPPEDDERLAAALCRLAGDERERLRLADAAVRRSQHYNWTSYRKKHLQAYNKLLEQRDGPLWTPE